MAEKTINLTGAEVAVTGLDGSHAAIRNDGADVIYAAKQPGITPGADGALSVPAGGSAVLRGISGTVYLSGTGSVMISTSDYNDNPFKSAAQGGSGADEQARAEISAHEGNAEIHITADDKANWNGKATLAEAAQVFSNPNLLLNPDFRINQRQKSVYDSLGYTVDRWYLWKYGASSYGTVSVSDNGIVLTSSGEGGSVQFCQPIENSALLAGRKVTVSFKAENVSGVWNIYQHGNTGSLNTISKSGVYNFTFDWADTGSKYGLMIALQGSSNGAAACTLKWTKLEIGSVATPFVPPDPAIELAKCQRYALKINGDLAPVILYSANVMWISVPTPVTMRAEPSIDINNLGFKTIHNSDGSIISDFDFSIDAVKSNSVIVRATKTKHGLTDVELCGGFGGAFTLLDAEI